MILLCWSFFHVGRCPKNYNIFNNLPILSSHHDPCNRCTNIFDLIHMVSHNSLIHYFWIILHSECLHISYHIFYIFQWRILLLLFRIYLGHKEGLYLLHLRLIQLNYLFRRRRGQVLLIGNGAIIKICNGIYFNINFYFVIRFPSRFIFISSQSGYCSSTITYFLNLLFRNKNEVQSIAGRRRSVCLNLK